jgi:ribosome biogenesis GTPase
LRPQQAPRKQTGQATEEALVVASFGRHVLIETPLGQRLLCHPRGKKNEAVVGDRVRWLPSQDEGTIESIEPRRNLLYRQDELRTKSFAANLDQVLILVAAEPEFSASQLSRALIAARAQGISALIALNKKDLGDSFTRAWHKLAPYRAMNETVLALAVQPGAGSAADRSDLADLPERLRGKTTLVLGPSGAGKSSLINALVPEAGVLTAQISQALGSGRHTTTRTSLYWLDPQRSTALIDSPGFQEFGLQHIEPMALASLMPDLKAPAQGCRFHNCTHRQEPGCAVIAERQASNSTISEQRYRIYLELFDELSRPPRY